MTDAAFTLQADVALAQSRTAPGIGRPADIERARRVAQDFEAFFLSQALQPMFADVGNDPMFGGGYAEKVWQAMQVDEYAKAMTRSGGVGIADAVLRQILATQEVQ